MTTLGILHPGAMGSSVGAAARARGARVLWCPSGRSLETRRRAEDDGLEPTSFSELVAACDVIASVCPPDAAKGVARSVAQQGYRGLYLDANAVSRDTALHIADIITSAGGSYVDGGIIGAPARAGRTTLLCLSGERAAEVAALFRGSPLEPQIVGPSAGQASALKMAFAAWTKGSTALLIAVRALAEAEGMTQALLEAWQRFSPELVARSEEAAVGAAPKAWRWSGEMREISRSFEAAGLPSHFHEGAAQLYERLERFKTEAPSLPAVIRDLLDTRRD